MEPNSRAYFGDKLRRTGTDALKAKVITGMPYEKFANIQNIYKNFRQRTKLTGSKTKQYMTTDKRRARGRVGEHKRLKPGQGALCERARKKQMRWRLKGRIAATSSINIITKANQTICSVQNTVCHLPGEIYDRTFKVETKELTPWGRPL